MNGKWAGFLAIVLLSVAVIACDDSQEVAEVPPPLEYGGEAIGYFCGMLLTEHGGPKGQVHLQSRATPLWFSSVRDTVAFTLLEGEPKDVAAIYVNDMGKATDWQEPEPGTWVEARAAWYVIGSRRMGGKPNSPRKAFSLGHTSGSTMNRSPMRNSQRRNQAGPN